MELFNLTNNNDTDKYSHLGYGIGFDSHSLLSILNYWSKNVIIFEVENSSSVHIDNKKNILVLAEGPTQGLDDASITAEAKYFINFAESGERFVLNIYYNESNIFLFVNVTKISFQSKRL